MATPDEYYAQLAAQKKAEATSQPAPYNKVSSAGVYSPPGGASISSPICPPQQPGGGPEGYTGSQPISITSSFKSQTHHDYSRSPQPGAGYGSPLSAGYGSPPGTGYAQSPPVYHVQQQAPEEVATHILPACSDVLCCPELIRWWGM